MKLVSKKVSICFLVFFAFVVAALFNSFNNVSASNSAGFLSAFLTPDGERAGWINVTVRDSRTGQRVSASLRSSASGGELSRTVANNEGKGTVAAKGRTDVRVESAGYNPLETYFVIDGNALDITVYVDPIEIPTQLRPEVVESKTRQGHTLVHGSVFEENGAPLTDARVYFRDFNLSADTDEKGYFELSIPTPSVDPTGDIPGKGELIVEKNGREVYRYSDMLIPEGAVHLILDTKADGVVRKAEQNKLTMNAEVQKNSQSYEPPAITETDPVARPSAVTVPPSIRVGSNCPNGRTTCTVFTVYTIDTYVRFGLDDEWIASWNANSLKAGAIAFRSYGAYHVYHPINAANYDICNTTSCQVCDPTDSATSTNNAAIQTTGSIVINSTSTDVLFSEYSAENNLGGCPDGFTGNNTTWPCLADPVDAGQAFSGMAAGCASGARSVGRSIRARILCGS